MAALGFAPVFQLAACVLLLAAHLLGRRCPDRRHGVAGQPATSRCRERIRAQIACCARTPTCGAPWRIDFIAQMTVAYFAVFGLILAVRRFGMPLQAAAGLVTLQGALYVATLFAGGALVLRWKEDLRYLVAFALLLGQTLLYGLGTGTGRCGWALRCRESASGCRA